MANPTFSKRRLMFYFGILAIVASVGNMITRFILDANIHSSIFLVLHWVFFSLMLLYFPCALRLRVGLSGIRIAVVLIPIVCQTIVNCIYTTFSASINGHFIWTSIIVLFILSLVLSVWGMWGKQGAIGLISSMFFVSLYNLCCTLGVNFPFPAVRSLAALVICPLFILFVILDLFSIKTKPKVTNSSENVVS